MPVNITFQIKIRTAICFLGETNLENLHVLTFLKALTFSSPLEQPIMHWTCDIIAFLRAIPSEGIGLPAQT